MFFISTSFLHFTLHRQNIKADKLQSDNIELVTDAGDIDVKTVYANTTTCSTDCGNICVQHLHGRADVSSSKGSLNVGMFDTSINLHCHCVLLE